MRKRKNVKFYIFYGLIVAAYIIASGIWTGAPTEMPPEDPGAAVTNVSYMIWVVGFGALIGLIGLFEQKKYTGYWMFEWSKFSIFIFTGILVSAMHFISLSTPQLIKPYMDPAAPYLKNNIILVCGMFLIGWALPSSIYKERLR